jgi:hypothetical protein
MRKVITINPKLAEGYLLLARGLLYEQVSLNERIGLVEKGLSLGDVRAQSSRLFSLGRHL